MKKIVERNCILTRRVVLYLRLSKEDIDKPTSEVISESIKNQELMLREEVAKHLDWKIIGVYCDEDFSGAGTYRPDFEKMIKLCENGQVDIVLCKSQSRFSRDMEIVEKYINNKFQEWNVRFVSLVDSADTENIGNKKSRQINALVNEWFLEDLSDNIKTTFRAKWKVGECTAAFTKYGLMKDPKNKNHLLIDPIASEVLKKIGSLILNGYGQDKIANILENSRIPCPYEYKLMNGCRLKLPINKKNDPTCISKSGKFIIKVYLYNIYKKILRNIYSVFIVGTETEKNFNSRFHLKVRSISEDLQLYYTTSNLPDIDNINLYDLNFDDEIWKQVKMGDIIPDNVYYIVSKNNELDRLRETGFELELELEKNKYHEVYKLFTKSVSSDDDKNISFQYEIRKRYQWNGKVIYNMMRNPEYNGTLIQGKTRRISYKNHKCIKSKSENWISSENALEKIFDDETWNAIQRKLNDNSRSQSNGTKHIFCGLVHCDECNSILCKNSSSSSNNAQKTEYLICRDKVNKWANCDNNKSIRLDILKEYVLKAINNMIKDLYDKNLLKKLYSCTIDKNFFKNKIQNLNKEKENISILILKKKKFFQQIYEDRMNNMIDDSDFISLRAKYKDDIDKFNKRVNYIDNELKNIKIKKELLRDNDNILLPYENIDELTPQLLDTFIDEIRVGKIKNNNEREIKIIWKF